jgi:hypothetical protein
MSENSYINGYLYAASAALDAIDSLISEAKYNLSHAENTLGECDAFPEIKYDLKCKIGNLLRVKKEVKHHLTCCKP